MKRALGVLVVCMAWSQWARAAEPSFKRVLDTPYPRHSGTAGGDMAIGDLNGDGHKDIVITGSMNSGPVTYVYLQNANGTFAPPLKASGAGPTEHGLPGLDAGCLRLADMDKDGVLDVVMYGKTGPSGQSSLFKVFRNNGKAHFDVMYDLGRDLPGEDFEDVAGAWGKTAGGKDNISDEDVHGLYNALGWSKGVLELADLDRDGNIDIVFAGTKGFEAGTDSAGQMIQRDWETSGVFLNKGKGKFAYLTLPGYPAAGIPATPEKDPVRSAPGIAKVSRGAGVLADLNGDKIPDLVLLGQANIGPKANPGIPETQRNGAPIAEVYLGRGDGTFARVNGHGLTPLIDCSVTTADVNKDGKVDLAVVGSTGSTKDPEGGRFTRIYFGKGDGTFAVDTAQTYQQPSGSAAVIAPTMSGDLAFGDLDGDGDLDMVVAGNAGDRSLFVYLNTNGKFSLVDLSKGKHGIGTNDVRGIAESDASDSCDVSVIDMDGDGDMDILVNGRGGSFQLLAFFNKAK